MPENRLPVKANKMLYVLHCKNENNWLSHVCFALYRYGFGLVWENQGVRNVNNFICQFRQRFIDCFLQEWHSGMFPGDRLAFYSSFKRSHPLAEYLCIIKQAVLRRNLIKFRLGVSPLKAHLRYTGHKEIMYAHFENTLTKQKFISSLYFPNIKRPGKPSCLKNYISVHMCLKWQFYWRVQDRY